MFDLPILVELLDYLNEKDTLSLAHTSHSNKEDILCLRKNACDKCIGSGEICAKGRCRTIYSHHGRWARCGGRICRNNRYQCALCQSCGDYPYYCKNPVCFHCKRHTSRLAFCSKCGNLVCYKCCAFYRYGDALSCGMCFKSPLYFSFSRSKILL